MRTELQALFKASFQRAFDALDPGERMILRLYVVDGLTIDDLARMLGVHRAFMALPCRRGGAREAAEPARGGMREAGDLATTDLRAVSGMFGSQFDVSVVRILRDAARPPAG